MSTVIEWTDETWNPVTGCTKVSPGCDNCYAERVTNRWKPGSFDTVTLHPDRLDKPLHWRKPRRVFVNSMSDLFHDDVPDEFIAEVFTVMGCASQHTFQILTKRHARMHSLLQRWSRGEPFWTRPDGLLDVTSLPLDADPANKDWTGVQPWPLPNVWLGVSVENQQWANIRIPALRQTPAAVRFLSCEPLLGPINLWEVEAHCDGLANPGPIDWCIVGGESGPNARPMDPTWARGLRDQCTGVGIPFFFKQWGGKTPKAGGAVLDGREWREFPQLTNAVAV